MEFEFINGFDPKNEFIFSWFSFYITISKFVVIGFEYRPKNNDLFISLLNFAVIIDF